MATDEPRAYIYDTCRNDMFSLVQLMNNTATAQLNANLR
jgi:hypothetical protein